MLALGHLLRIKNAERPAAAGELNYAAVETGRLAGLDPGQDVVRHQIELALHCNAALADFEHAGMHIADRIHAVDGLCGRSAEKHRTL